MESTPEKVKSTQAANSAILSAIKSAGKRKRVEYSNYDSPQRAKIAKYACEHGNASAVRHFAKILGKPINESTARSMKKQYLRELDHSPDRILTELPKCKTGRPLLLGSMMRRC